MIISMTLGPTNITVESQQQMSNCCMHASPVTISKAHHKKCISH